MYRDAYFNTAPRQPGEADDRPTFRYYADLADSLVAQRSDLIYTGPLFGLTLLDAGTARA
jgi:hypothetical protein